MTEATPSPGNSPGSPPASATSAAPKDVSKQLLRTSSMQAQRNWLSRNKRWFIPLVVGGPLLLIILSFGITAVVTIERIKSSDPYRAALAAVQAHPEAVAQLGEPITGGWLAMSNYTSVDGVIQSPANVSIRVRGPRGEGNVRAQLERVSPGTSPETATGSPPATSAETGPAPAGEAPATQGTSEAFVPPVVNGWRVVWMDLGVGERETGVTRVLVGDPNTPPADPEQDAD